MSRAWIRFAPLLCLALASAGGAEESAVAPRSWSADLLTHILKAEPPAESPPAAPAAERALRTYQLRYLKVGASGKAQAALAMLEKLLPAGSAVNPDVPANSVHVLTTPSAHAALWEYLSTIDAPETIPETAAVPPEVGAALHKLAAVSEQSEKLAAAVASMDSRLGHDLPALGAQQRQELVRFGWAGFGVVVTLGGAVGWMLRRKPPGAAVEPSGTLALAPESLALALQPAHEKMRGEMLGLLNEVAIKLQAQHQEQRSLALEQHRQFEDARQALAEERQQFIAEAGGMVAQAVERVDATTTKLARQQDKVADLVGELQGAVRELDATKDALRTKEIELEQERSKLAALSILLEEGGPLPSALPAAAAEAAPVLSCMPNQSIMETPAQNPVPAPTRFHFLPPDAPET